MIGYDDRSVAEKMVDYIKSHGHDAYIADDHSCLHVKDVWTYRKDDGTIGSGEEWSTINFTWNNVRNWLGY